MSGWAGRLGALLLAVACGSAPRVEPPAPEESYARGIAAFRAGDCRRALEAFRAAERVLAPRASAVADVRFHIAECQLAQGQYLEGAQLFRRVADEYPAHRLAPYALLRAGDANAELWRRPELDPTYGQAALAVYRELLARYPDSEVAPRARGRLRDLSDWFAEKDYKTALFYLQRGAYDSAILYLRAVVANYGQSRLVPEALLKLVQVYAKIGYREELTETCAFLRQQYPQTPGLDQSCPAAGS